MEQARPAPEQVRPAYVADRHQAALPQQGHELPGGGDEGAQVDTPEQPLEGEAAQLEAVADERVQRSAHGEYPAGARARRAIAARAAW